MTVGFQFDGGSLVLFLPQTAVQSWISHTTTGICFFLVSKLKENM